MERNPEKNFSPIRRRFSAWSFIGHSDRCLAGTIKPYDPYEIDISQKMQGMSASHIFGTDDYGRDYLTRALYGGRVSLLVGFCSMFITVIIGTTIGVFSGYIGGKWI